MAFKVDSLTAAGTVNVRPCDYANNQDNVAEVQVSGDFATAVATLQSSQDADDEADALYAAVQGIRLDTGVVENTPTLTNGTTRKWKCPIDAASQFRFNLTSIASGTITVSIRTYFVEGGIGLINSSQAVSTVANTVTAASANALAVGANGATNPVLNVDSAAASVATGVGITGAAAGSRVVVAAISSGANEGITINAKAAASVRLAAAATNTAVEFSAPAVPTSSDGVALGSASLQWSDLFLAEGGVINWDNGDVTITQTNNVLAVAGTTSTTFDGQVNPATNDAASLGTTALGWSDLHLATGAVINFANGEVTITETDANTLTIAGATTVSFGANTLNATGTRILQSYHTNITSTNAVTVDSSATVKENIKSYDEDALSIVNQMDVVTYNHSKKHLDSNRRKLGVIAESVAEDLALDQIPSESDNGSTYPGINTYALSALHTKAIQQLTNKVAELEARLASRN